MATTAIRVNTSSILKYLLAFLLVITLVKGGLTVQSRFVQQVSCPRPEFIQPCTCRMTVYGMHVVCLRVSDVNALQRIFTVLKDYELGTLLLQDFELPSFSQCYQLFRGLKPVILRLVTCELPVNSDSSSSSLTPEDNQYILEGMASTLKRIDITKCNVGNEGLQQLGLGRLPQLTEVNVLQEQLGVVGKDWFKSVPGLYQGGQDALKIKVVRLEDSGITEVQPKAFAELTNLVVLSLAKNSINRIGRNVFPIDAQSLTTIDLSHNALTGLPNDFFNNMPALQKVLLYNNKITNLNFDVWQHVFQSLDTLWIYDNPLICDDRMNWIVAYQKPRNLEGSCEAPDDKKGVHLTDTQALVSETLAETS